MTRLCAILTLLLMTSACEGTHGPRGVGGGTDDFERSPCACAEPFYRGGEWVG